ncbi:uncharacterized protein LOC122295755 isoform X2 [Carya illinoinensis]|nr:uncharacterized protein LOC122295755 isoform X2 [Carya illinoinensis]
MPPFGPTMPYPPSTNLEELRQGEDTTQHSAMSPCGPSMPVPICASGSSSMPFSVESENDVGETSLYKNVSPNAEGMFEVSDDDNKIELPKVGTLEISLKVLFDPTQLRGIRTIFWLIF